MIDALAVVVWTLIAFFLGIVPAAWFISNDNILAGLLAAVTGYGLGAGAAELILRTEERRK